MIDLSAYKETLNGKPLAVFGLGVSGMATIKALAANNIEIFTWDDHADKRRDAESLGAKCIELNAETLKKCSALILSPGVPLTHPEPHSVVKAAQEADIEIYGDLEILHRSQHDHKTIGITGTNGKSTTTALLTHVLNECGKSALMGGNIGVPALALDPQSEDTIFVLEISSYQIDLCPTYRPDIAILLNITPDHIDRHGTFENYAAIKHRLLEGAGLAIKAADYPLPTNNFPLLPGDHNKQNIAAVLKVCEALNIPRDTAINAIQTFPGLAHRQYLVREINGVKYINDSKATNAEAVAKALGSYDNIYWIAGGQAKDGGLIGLEKLMPRIKQAYLIGEAADEFAEYIQKQFVSYRKYESLIEATKAAHNDATAAGQGVVLLSPACASWDQFKSFEHRGEVFENTVRTL